MNDSLVAGTLRIDLGVENGLHFALAVGHQFAVAIDEPAMADETKTAFFADAVDGDVVDMILQSAGVADVLHRSIGAGRPIRGQQNDVGAEQSQDARYFGKAAVVANV